jgi:uncharacterized DUF497 family protein
MKLTFEWDEVKAKENVRKHKIPFDEGKTIFNDPFLLTYPDIANYEAEERFINIGVSAKGRILVLIHTERHGNIRIISCRKATVRERRHYEES